MADDDDLNEDTPEQQESSVVNRLRKELRDLRKTVTENAEALKAGSSAQRELAMLKAGINPQAPGAEWFIKGYDGDLDPDKIRAAGAAFVGQPQQPALPQPPAGSVPPWEQPNPNPYFAAAAQQQAEQASWTQAQGVTQAQEPPGVNHLDGMKQAGEKGGAAGIAAYMAAHGIPVVGNWNAQGGYEVQ